MRLPILFTAFLLGLIYGFRIEEIGPEWLHLLWLIPGIALFLLLRLSYRVVFSVAAVVAFIFGIVWAANLPTWPRPLNVEGLPFDRGCTAIGRTTSEPFECPSGRYIPLSLEAIRPEGFDSVGHAIQGEWQSHSGIVLAMIPRRLTGVSGARYRIHGRLINIPERLHEPVLIRYTPCAIFAPQSGGHSIERIGDADFVARSVLRLRYLLMSHLSWGLNDQQGELVAGITFGRKGRRLGGSWAGDFYQAGLSHLIVASGAQVSLLFLPLLFLMGRVRLPSLLRIIFLVLLGIALVGFTKLLGGEPSILRAAAMGCILLLSIGMGRKTYGLATLAAAGLFWLVKNPLLVRDTGFLLSFGASFGIIYFTPSLFERFAIKGRIDKPDLDLLRPMSWIASVSYGFRVMLRLLVDWTLVTIAAQIGVVPVLACTVGKVSPAGFIANLFAVPIAQIILYLGALSGIGGFISPAISLGINFILGYLATGLMNVAHDFANIPYAGIPIDPLPGWTAFAWYAGCVLIVEGPKAVRSYRIRSRMKQKKEPETKSKPGSNQREEWKSIKVVDIDLDDPIPPEMI